MEDSGVSIPNINYPLKYSIVFMVVQVVPHLQTDHTFSVNNVPTVDVRLE